MFSCLGESEDELKPVSHKPLEGCHGEMNDLKHYKATIKDGGEY